MHKNQNNPKTSKNEKMKDARNSTLTHLSVLCACSSCCSSCCCSDKGNTKSTPSSNSDVWTLYWGLTKIISKFW